MFKRTDSVDGEGSKQICLSSPHPQERMEDFGGVSNSRYVFSRPQSSAPSILDLVPISVCGDSECLCPTLGFSNHGHNVLLPPMASHSTSVAQGHPGQGEVGGLFSPLARGSLVAPISVVGGGEILLHRGPMFHNTRGRLLRAPRWNTCFAILNCWCRNFETEEVCNPVVEL